MGPSAATCIASRSDDRNWSNNNYSPTTQFDDNRVELRVQFLRPAVGLAARVAHAIQATPPAYAVRCGPCRASCVVVMMRIGVMITTKQILNSMIIASNYASSFCGPRQALPRVLSVLPRLRLQLPQPAAGLAVRLVHAIGVRAAATKPVAARQTCCAAPLPALRRDARGRRHRPFELKARRQKTRARACVPRACRGTPVRAVSCVQFVTRAWKSRRPRYAAQSVLVESPATGAELRTSPHFCLPSLLSPAPKRGRENADRLLRQNLLQSVLRRVCTVQFTLAMCAQPPVSTLIKDKAWRFAMRMCCAVPEVCDTLRGWTRMKSVPSRHDSRTPRGTKSSQLLRNYALDSIGKIWTQFFFPDSFGEAHEQDRKGLRPCQSSFPHVIQTCRRGWHSEFTGPFCRYFHHPFFSGKISV